MDHSCVGEMYLINDNHMNHQNHQARLLQSQVVAQHHHHQQIPDPPISNQYHPQQQVSSPSDHHQMISDYNRESINVNSVNYNYELQEDTWTPMDQSNNNLSQISHQTDQVLKSNPIFCINNSLEPTVTNQHEVNSSNAQHNYQPHSAITDAFEFDSSDFNNNQQTQPNQLNQLHNLKTIPSQAQESYRDQFFSNTTLYVQNSELNANGYNQDAEQMYDINRYNDPSRHQVPVIRDLPDIRHNNDKPIHCYPQAEPSSTHHPQYYDQETHSTLNSQLYQQPTQLDTSIQQVVFKPNDNCNAHHQDQPPAFEQATSADQYQAPRSAYTSLQQLTMNCDNYANQVSTTTATLSTGLPGSASANKTRSLKGRRGRPRKKGVRSKNKVNGKLWEFIRDLLLNEHTNPSFIRWERREDGVFKFVQSDKVAKMWGERKQNPKMTYEKLSRAMRYYYKSKVLLPVFGRRLVYKFGPNATGWLPVDGEPMY